MTVQVRIQAKTEEILASEAEFFGVNPTDLLKAICDKVIAGGLTRQLMQGVDVKSYHERRAGRPAGAPKIPRENRPLAYSFDGKPVTLASIAKKYGIPRSTLWKRTVGGMTLEQAVGASQ